MSILTNILQAFSRPLKWWIVIAPWEQGLRVRIGKTAKELCPGIHLRLPFLDKIYVKSVRIRYVTQGAHTVSSRDNTTFSIGIAVKYRIESMKCMYLSIADPETTIYLAAAAAVSDYVCLLDAEQIRPAGIKDAANDAVKEVGQGLADIKVSIINFAQTRCYRFITGDGWVSQSMENLDSEDSSGEKT